MRRRWTVLVVVLAVAGGVLPVVGVQAAAPTPGTESGSTWGQTVTADAENSSETAPGTRLAGSVGAQGAELGGELETRSFEHQVNRSNSNASKAQVVARQANQSQSRLVTLRTQLRELEAAREDGRISEAEYRVRAAQLSARVTALERVTNRTTETARALPAETLRRNGVNVTALETLRAEAGRLTGPEVAAIARSIAGPGAARGDENRAKNASSGNSESSGPPEGAARSSGAERAGNASESGSPHETTPGESSTGNETAAGSDQQRGGDGADGNGQGPPSERERGNDRTENDESGSDSGSSDANGGGASDGARERGSGASDRSESEDTDTGNA